MAVLNNTMMQGTSADTGDDAYQIEKSLRFNAKKGACLTRFMAVKGDQLTWTLSFWLKVHDLSDNYRPLFHASQESGAAAPMNYIRLQTDHTLVCGGEDSNSAGSYFGVGTVRKLRDPSAWYHVCITMNSTLQKDSERTCIYINGEFDTVALGDGYIGQNKKSSFNNIKEHYIGLNGEANNNYNDISLADVRFIDGLALPPEAFGKKDSLGEWIPREFKLPTANDGTVWSDYHSGYNNSEADGYPHWQIFDGDGTTRGGNGDFSSSNNFLFEPTNAFKNCEKFEVYIDNVRTQIEYRLKSGSTWGIWNDFNLGSNLGWEDCTPNIVNNEVSGFEVRVKSDSSFKIYLGGYRVNGILLVDGKVDPEELNNRNDGSSWTASTGTALDSPSNVFNGECSGGVGATVDTTARTLLDDDLVVNKQFAIFTNAANNTGITLTDADSNVYAFRTGPTNNAWMWLNSTNSNTAKTNFTGTLKGPITIKQASGSSTIGTVMVDGYKLMSSTVDNSYWLKFNETANVTQLGHDALVDSAVDTKVNYTSMIRSTTSGPNSRYNVSLMFDGNLTTTTNGPNHGGILLVDFTPIGGVAYTNGVELYMIRNGGGDGQYDAYRLNQTGSFTDVPSTGDWGWFTAASGSGTMNQLEIRDSTNNDVSGMAEGIIRAIRINGDTILTDRGGTNWTVNKMQLADAAAVTYTGTSSGFSGNSANNIFDGDESTTTEFGSSYCTITTHDIDVRDKLEVRTNSGSNSGNPDRIQDGDSNEYQIYNTGSTGWHRVLNTNYNQSADPLAGKLKGPIKIKRHSGSSHLYGVKVDGVWLQDIDKTYTDSRTDTPTNYEPAVGSDATGGVTRGNYCTVNPLTNTDHGYGTWTITNGNLTAHAVDGTSSRIGCTMGASSGKWYWEVDTKYIGNAAAGIGINAADTDYHADWNTGDYALYLSGHNNNGTKHRAGTGTDWGDELLTGDVIGVQWDADNGSIYFWRNGVIQESGAAAFTGLSGMYVPCGVCTSSVQENILYFNFGQRAFKYTNAGTNRPSADYKCLCTQNLPDTFSGAQLNDPSKYFTVKLFGGDDTTDGSKKIKYPFSPDLVWMKGRNSAYHHRLFDRIRGQGSLAPDNTSIPNTDANSSLTTFDSDGISIEQTGDESYNNITDEYVSFAWDAGEAAATASTEGSVTPSVQWVNNTAGFSISKYTGDHPNVITIGHGLSTKPDFCIFKNLEGAENWLVYHKDVTAEKAFYMNTTAAPVDLTGWFNDTEPTNTIITLGNSTQANHDTKNHLCFAWTSIPGYSAFGSYVGNGLASAPFIYTGFQPRWVLIKSTGVANWFLKDTARDTKNPRLKAFLVDSNSAESDLGDGYDWDILSNGFKISNTSELNTSGTTHIYAAFAEHPQKIARAQ